VLAGGLEAQFHSEAEPLVRALEQHGFSLHVVSGSAHWLVQAAVESLGIPAEHVLGARVHLDGARLSDRLAEPLTFWEGKMAAIESWIGPKRPKVVFGDSAGDLAMLEAAQLPVAVNPRPGLVKALDERRPGSWRRLLPGTTVGGHTVTQHETDRIVV
jgi:phosphoserine phosphatase